MSVSSQLQAEQKVQILLEPNKDGEHPRTIFDPELKFVTLANYFSLCVVVE